MMFAGKRALVTGAGTGIGQGIAIELAKRGADVVLHYCHSEQGALNTAQELCGAGHRARAMHADFRDPTTISRLGEDAVNWLGGLDFLVNSAGVTMNLPFGEITLEMFETLYNINVKAPYFLTREVLPALRATRGRIVNITSIHAYEGMREHSIYAGTRGAIVSWTRQLAVELAPQGIRVNGVAPGMIPVERYYRTMPDFDPQQAGTLLPMGRPGTVEEIAKTTAFLLSDDAAFIAGQTIIVDGGTTSWMPFCAEDFAGALPYRFGTEYVPGLSP